MFAFLLFRYEKLRQVFMARNHWGGAKRSLLCRTLMRCISRDRGIDARTPATCSVCSYSGNMADSDRRVVGVMPQLDFLTNVGHSKFGYRTFKKPYDLT